MKHFTLIFALSLAFSLPLKAQDQPSAKNIALATELVEVMHLERGMSVGMEGMKQIQAKMADAASTNVSPDTKEMMQKAMDFSGATAVSVMNWDKIKPLYVSAYASVYTAEELQGAIDFYKSPIGQKWVAKQPQISTAIMAKTMEMAMAAQPQIMDSIKKSMGALDALRKGMNLTNLPALPVPTASPSN